MVNAKIITGANMPVYKVGGLCLLKGQQGVCVQYQVATGAYCLRT